MKRVFLAASIFITLALGGTAYGVTGTADVPGHVADYTAGLAANGIGSSRHNLGAFGRVLTTAATTEICIFCHTPHHANTTAVPLWNKSTANSVNYTAYGTTIAGTTVNNGDLSGPSLACLSCHDGVSTFDSIVNAPGKGLASGDQNWAFRMPSTWFSPNTFWDHFDKGNTGWSCRNCHEYSFGGENPSDRLSLDNDLTNDHPVSIVYSGGQKASLRPEGTVINSINLTSDLVSGADTLYGGNLSQNRWAVAGFISDTATIGDLLRNGKVECSSCHDPHFRNLSWDEAEPTWDKYPNLPSSYCVPGEDCSDGNFLRRVGGNTGSGVCRTCHWK